MPPSIALILFLITFWAGVSMFIIYITLMKRGSTPFHRACSAGKLEKVQAILQAQPDRLNEPDRFGVCPAQYAAGWGRLPVLEYLIAQGADINQAQKGWTPLTLACAAGNQAVFDLLLSHNAQINPPSGVPPLHAAVNQARMEMTKVLLAKGANVNQPGQDDVTPLHLAAWRAHLALIQILLEAGADKDAKDNQGLTPRDYTKQERHPEAQKMLSSP
jgi:uncharacterized protein